MHDIDLEAQIGSTSNESVIYESAANPNPSTSDKLVSDDSAEHAQHKTCSSIVGTSSPSSVHKPPKLGWFTLIANNPRKYLVPKDLRLSEPSGG